MLHSIDRNPVMLLFKRINKELCPEVATAVIRMIIEELGGLQVTIPSYETIWLLERNSKIRKEYNGKNLQELKERFGISKKQIRRILKDKRG